MADNFGLFWNSINADRTYDADSFAEWLRKFFTTGVFNGEMQVTPDSGMVVNVAPGYANIEGKVRFFESVQAFTIEPASGVYPRIDSIVVRSDSTARAITCEYVKGDYSGESPTAPTPTRAGGVYEIVLAQIYVSAGATAILTNDITDTRADDELCGWVTSTVEGVPMDQIVSQMQADFSAWYDRMKGQLSEDAAGNLQLQIDETNTRIEEVNTNIESEIGDTDISTIGDGTLSGAVSALNNGLTALNAYSVGDLTKVSSNISAVEYARYMRIGDIAWVTANFTIGTAISDSTPVLFSGAPKARRYLRSTGMMVQGQAGRYIRYEINTEGQIRGSYTKDGIATGMYEITLCYPCQD